MALANRSLTTVVKSAATKAVAKVTPAAPKAGPVAKTTAVAKVSNLPRRPPAAGGNVVARKPMTPAELKAKAVEAARRKALITFNAPENFSNTSFVVDSYFGDDGLAWPVGKIEAIRGRWNNPEARRVDMSTYAPEVVYAIYARLGMVLGSTSTDMNKRMPVRSRFQSFWAVGRRSKDGTLMVALRDVQMFSYSKTAGWTSESILKSEDPGHVIIVRRFKRAKNFLIAPMTRLQNLPTVSEFKKLAQQRLGHDVL